VFDETGRFNEDELPLVKIQIHHSAYPLLVSTAGNWKADITHPTRLATRLVVSHPVDI